MARLIIAGGGMPVGAIAEFPGTVAPRGWVEARGDVELSRTEYARLWAYAQASGNLAADEASKEDGQWGPGDGVTTFTTPEYRGPFRRGWDNGRGFDPGRGIGTYQADENKSHGHTGSTNTTDSHGHDQWGTKPGGTSSTAASMSSANSGWYSGKLAGAGAHAHSLSTDESGGAEARPRNVSVLVCIKT